MSTLIDSRMVGQSIKHLRLSKNWTQDYLADTVGYSVRNLRRIENDGTASIDVVNTFADIFEVSALDILSGDVFCLPEVIKNDSFQVVIIVFIILVVINIFFIVVGRICLLHFLQFLFSIYRHERRFMRSITRISDQAS